MAITRLGELGYNLEDINVLMSDKTRSEEFADITPRKATEGAVAGAIIGGGISAVVASLAATGSIAAITATGSAAIPLVAGPLAAALGALGAGGLGGGVLGALIGAGMSEAQAKKFENAMKNGGIVIGVHARDEDRDRVKEILSQETTNGGTTLGGSRETTETVTLRR